MSIQRKFICLKSELGPGQAKKFLFEEEDVQREGFIAHAGREFVAYENVCRHLPLSLDYGGADFFTQDKEFFICRNHGAIYEPLTGKCVRGPCQGAWLKRMRVECVGDELWVGGAG